MTFSNENPKFCWVCSLQARGQWYFVLHHIYRINPGISSMLFFFLQNKCANQHFEVLHLTSHLWKLASLVKISMLDPIPHQFDNGFCNVK
jgi:hypothetical protein